MSSDLASSSSLKLLHRN